MKFALDRYRPEGEWVATTLWEKVVGVHYRKDDAMAFASAAAKAERNNLQYGVILQEEPDNPYDSKAIAVYGCAERRGIFKSSVKCWHIGYLNRDLASELHDELLRNGHKIAAELVHIYEGPSGYLDFTIEVLAPPGWSFSSRRKKRKEQT